MLDIGEQLLEKLAKAGYKHIADVIDAGPEKLASDKVIDPIEVIELAQALSEFVEVEMEKPAQKTKPKKTTKSAKAVKSKKKSK
jgi:hypothetical protein